MSHKSGGHLPQLYTVATLGSHSALQILKGAKDEGFHTLAVVTPMNERLYSSFAFVDETIVIPRYSDFPKLEREFKKRKIILVPHGSFVAYLSMDEHKAMTTPYFGNKAVLDWEADRMRQRHFGNLARKRRAVASPISERRSHAMRRGRRVGVARNAV